MGPTPSSPPPASQCRALTRSRYPHETRKSHSSQALCAGAWGQRSDERTPSQRVNEFPLRVGGRTRVPVGKVIPRRFDGLRSVIADNHERGPTQGAGSAEPHGATTCHRVRPARQHGVLLRGLRGTTVPIAHRRGAKSRPRRDAAANASGDRQARACATRASNSTPASRAVCTTIDAHSLHDTSNRRLSTRAV
jgi:hypothetical protein